MCVCVCVCVCVNTAYLFSHSFIRTQTCEKISDTVEAVSEMFLYYLYIFLKSTLLDKNERKNLRGVLHAI